MRPKMTEIEGKKIFSGGAQGESEILVARAGCDVIFRLVTMLLLPLPLFP
jgi:hypothetical protein